MNLAIARLVDYAVRTGLVAEEERYYTVNRLLDVLELDEWEEAEDLGEYTLEGVLEEILSYAAAGGLMKEDSITYRDLFDTKIMGVLTPGPRQVTDTFFACYEESPGKATDYFYKLCLDSNYIRKERVKKDRKWTVPSPYGTIELSINLSKPEKDPKAIAAAGKMKSSSYPKCQLCMENVGYAGRVDHPARQNLRVIPITIQGQPWGFQYSPYVYYNEHCIVLNQKHVPMKIDGAAFAKLFDFVTLFPHYFVGSNADLPIVGGSILSHEHFQGGHHEFPMAVAQVKKKVVFTGFEEVEAGILEWPMSVLRLRGKDCGRLVELADKILLSWRGYTDEAAMIFAETEGEPHNTITPIARKNGEDFELDLVLRNNLTTEEYPLGLYHPHKERHHIKKENIGLIEVMGLAILPARLEKEMAEVAKAILAGEDIREREELEKHADWLAGFLEDYSFTEENVMDILQQEIGKVFVKVLEDAGVYKATEEGLEAFQRFVQYVNEGR